MLVQGDEVTDDTVVEFDRALVFGQRGGIGAEASDGIVAGFAAADLVVLPFREIMNSGSAVLALSFDRPVLVPEMGSMPELQTRVGAEWVRTYQGELNATELTKAIRWAHDWQRPAKPDLSDFDWSNIARETVAAFKQLTERNSATACASVAGTDSR